MTNAFEDQNKDEPIPEINDPIVAGKVLLLDAEIKRIQDQNERLRGMGLHRTADANTAKLQRLLQEKRDLLEG